MIKVRTGLAAVGLMALAACAQAPEQSASAVAPQPQPAAPVRTVAVELFTSQGCSSCPPADAVLERIGREPSIVVLSRPVTYWDRLGWPDTFGRPEHDALQRRYQARMQLPDHYTPQAVVQGTAQLIGSHEPVLRERIAEARRGAGPTLTVARDAVSVSGVAARPAEVRLVALRSHADVPIGRGENGGRTVRYTNVVLDERPIGRWTGGEARFAVPAEALRVAGADRYAVIVQELEAGPIVAAGYL